MGTRLLPCIALAVAQSLHWGCAGSRELTREGQSLEERVAALRAEQTKRQEELDGLRVQIERAQAEVAHRQFEAQVAALKAGASYRTAACMAGLAEHGRCMAAAAAKTTGTGFWGCVGGLAAAILTGGAAAPFAAGGCGVGLTVGSAMAEACVPPPECTNNFEQNLSAAMAAQGLQELPQCASPAPSPSLFTQVR